MSASLEEQQASLDAAFAQRAADLTATLARGRKLQAAYDPVPQLLADAWRMPPRSADVWGVRRSRSANGVSAAVSSKAAVAFGETDIWTGQKRSSTKKAERPSTEIAGEQLSLF